METPLLEVFFLYLIMEAQDLQKLKYPIGQFECPDPITAANLKAWVEVLEFFPARLEALVKPLTEEQLDTPYRPEGWTIRQVIHHLADSHHHSYTRFKWALTEITPLIKAYNEADWAELFDSKTAPIEISLQYLRALHAKLVHLIKGLPMDSLEAGFIHPETNKKINLKTLTGIYAWHSKHHYAHIESLLKRRNW
ncbi:YfiT family bacillithiol transferase [Gaetbulibacter sp. M240]|uniref:YfiT family bacillithiol transferase n=1 Tax=Gaetbulibacter sp. M240 TaxID=3126511 RepID=UPI00374F36DE